MAADDVARHLTELAALRITVFAEYPYLYDGDLDYERRYLDPYLGDGDRDAIVVGAWHGARLVGASTGTPMEDHADAFAAGLAGSGIAAGDVFYCAESVLLPEYRGLGVGHRLFDLREAHARRLGRAWSAFCAVVRPADHPACPPGYRPLDPFWMRRGYAPMPGAFARFSWKDVGEVGETEKPLQFWIRRLEKEVP